MAPIQNDAVKASFCSSTIGTSRIARMPSASVRMPENVGTNSAANERTIASSCCQPLRLYSS